MHCLLTDLGYGSSIVESDLARAPVTMITHGHGSGDAEVLLNDGAVWSDLEFDVALDYGSVVHVCADADTPGYAIEESPGSKRKQNFLMGDGGEIPNKGQKSLNLVDSVHGNSINGIFQIAAVTRPLMSVGKICDEGLTVVFQKNAATVFDKDKNPVCLFERQGGGLYIARLSLKAASPRPDRADGSSRPT